MGISSNTLNAMRAECLRKQAELNLYLEEHGPDEEYYRMDAEYRELSIEREKAAIEYIKQQNENLERLINEFEQVLDRAERALLVKIDHVLRNPD